MENTLSYAVKLDRGISMIMEILWPVGGGLKFLVPDDILLYKI